MAQSAKYVIFGTYQSIRFILWPRAIKHVLRLQRLLWFIGPSLSNDWFLLSMAITLQAGQALAFPSDSFTVMPTCYLLATECDFRIPLTARGDSLCYLSLFVRLWHKVVCLLKVGKLSEKIAPFFFIVLDHFNPSNFRLFTF